MLIEKGKRYLFIPKGLSTSNKVVTVETEPMWNAVVGEEVVKVAELFGLCPVSSLMELHEVE